MTFNPFAAIVPATPWLPSDNNLLVANGDPWLVSGATALTAGTLYLAKMNIRNAVSLANLWFGMSTPGVGASTGSFAGLYSSSGALLSGSADIGAILAGASGGIACPLSSPQQLAAGSFVWAAILANLATTQPTLIRTGAGSVVSNAGLPSVSAWRFAVNGTGLAALPGSIVPAANAGTGGTNLWAGGS